jgi:HTH-type transcriptional regulator/antitoxin HigA
MTQRTPAEVFSPGEYLRDEIEARGWTQSEFAEIIGRPPGLVSDLIRGRRGITPATAKELAAALGTSPMFWLNLDSAYQLARTDPAPTRIHIEAKLRERFPVREMLARGWIEPSSNPDVLQARVQEFFELESWEDEVQMQAAARKTALPENYRALTPLQTAWLFRVKQIASAMQAPPFKRDCLNAALEKLHELMGAPESIGQVPAVLEECGIRFLVIEPLPGAKIDGACFWLDGHARKPVIAMSLRLDRIDNFWFVLRHEIEHVLQGHARFDADLSESPEPEELAVEESANSAAAEFTVPADEMADFVARVQPIFSERRVVGFARRLGVHPGIVVGRLQHTTDRWNLLRKFQVKVREHVVPAAITDGYGQSISV